MFYLLTDTDLTKKKKKKHTLEMEREQQEPRFEKYKISHFRSVPQ